LAVPKTEDGFRLQLSFDQVDPTGCTQSEADRQLLPITVIHPQLPEFPL
jgi:hypothetical protein